MRFEFPPRGMGQIEGRVTSKLLTIAEVAERLRVSRRTAYRLVKQLDASPSAPLRITERDLERYIHSRMRGRDDTGRHPLAQFLVDDARAAVDSLPACCIAPGYTYFVLGVDLIKIGSSKQNLGSRLAQLQAQSPIALRLIRIARGRHLEPLLHERLGAHRAHGEWFSAEPVLELLKRAGACVRCWIEL